MSQATPTPWPRKQPLVLVAAFFALGIVMQQMLQLNWTPDSPNAFGGQSVKSFLLLFVAGSLVWAMISWRVLSPPWPVLPLVMAAGTLLAACQNATNEGWSSLHLRRLVLRVPQHLILRGVIRSDPALRDMEEKKPSSRKEEAELPPTVLADFEIEISAVRFLTTWEPARGRVMVRAREAASAPLEFGQEIEVDGVLSEPNFARNFGVFDYAAYLRRMGIQHVLRATDADSVRVVGPAKGWGWIFAARKKLSDRLTLGIEKDELAVGIIRGMLLGYREDIPQDVNDTFRRTGTLHVFAISGSHITLIGLALLVVLRLLRVPPAWACVVVAPVLVFYVVATGLRASAIRSLIMAGVVIIGWSLQRPSALLNNLAASALIILAWDPFQLFDPGCQLSFVVVTALILLSPPIERRLFGWVEPDPYIPRVCLPRWRLRLIDPCRALATTVAVCLAAWIGSFGIILYYFNLISLSAMIANLLIVPLAAASVALGTTSLMLGAMWNQIAITLNTTHALLIHAMVFISEHLARIPKSCFYAPQPTVAWIVVGYIWLTTTILFWLQKKKARSLGLGLAGVCLVGGVWLTAWMSDEVRIDVLDVGGGQSVLITGPRFERLLLDAGNTSQGRTLVEPFLRSRGVNAVDVLVLSHGDAAHYGGASHLLGNIPFRRVLAPDATFRSKGYRKLLAELEQAGVRIEYCHGGEGKRKDEVRRMKDEKSENSKQNSFQLHSGILSTLWPPSSGRGLPWKSNRSDDFGLALELKTKFGRCLFAADAGKSVEAMISPGVGIHHVLLVQGLHANEDSLTAPYLKAIAPEVIVLNSGEYPPNVYPSPEVQARLKSSGARVYRTDQSGGVTIRLNKERIQCQSFFGEPVLSLP